MPEGDGFEPSLDTKTLLLLRRRGLRARCRRAAVRVSERFCMRFTAARDALSVGDLLGDLVTVSVHVLGDCGRVAGGRRDRRRCRCGAWHAN